MSLTSYPGHSYFWFVNIQETWTASRKIVVYELKFTELHSYHVDVCIPGFGYSNLGSVNIWRAWGWNNVEDIVLLSDVSNIFAHHCRIEFDFQNHEDTDGHVGVGTRLVVAFRYRTY